MTNYDFGLVYSKVSVTWFAMYIRKCIYSVIDWEVRLPATCPEIPKWRPFGDVYPANLLLLTITLDPLPRIDWRQGCSPLCLLGIDPLIVLSTERVAGPWAASLQGFGWSGPLWPQFGQRALHQWGPAVVIPQSPLPFTVQVMGVKG